MKRKWLYRAPGILLIVLAAVTVLGFVVQNLWNWLMPAIAGWHVITFWQAIGILILCKILFGGFRGRNGMHWRHRLGERWQKMTPEEREKFSQALRSRCGTFRPEEQRI